MQSIPAISADRTVTYRVSPMQTVSPAVEIFNVIALPAGQVNAPYSFTFKDGRWRAAVHQSRKHRSFRCRLVSSFQRSDAVRHSTGGGQLRNPADHFRLGRSCGERRGHNLTVAPAGAASPLVRNGSTVFPDASVGVPFIQPMVETSLAIRGGACAVHVGAERRIDAAPGSHAA